MQDNTEKILEDLIIKAKELGITFKNGPATLETIYDNKIFHVLEEMSDDVFIELLTKKIEQFESKKFLSILQKHSLVDNTENNNYSNPTFNPVSDTIDISAGSHLRVSKELILDKSSLPLTKQED